MSRRTKLSELQKIEARAEWKARKALRTLAQMARDYGVTITTMYRYLHDDQAEVTHKKKVRQYMENRT